MEIVKRDSDNVVVSRVDSILKTTSKILARTKTANLIDTSWIDRIFLWADANGVSELILPRDRSELLSIEELNLSNLGLTDIPPELGKLTNLKKLYLAHNKLIKIPKEIGNLSEIENAYSTNGNYETKTSSETTRS